MLSRPTGVGSPRVSWPATPTSTSIACGEQPGDTADPVLLDMVLHRLGEVARRPLRVESTHMGFDATTVEKLIGGALGTGMLHVDDRPHRVPRRRQDRQPSAVQPARQVAGVAVAALAARDVARAQAMASNRGIPKVHDDDAVIDDSDVDAVYNPLPNGLHGRLDNRRARGGKHVLCEKPFTANTEEAEGIAEVAHEPGSS